jgi:hypothetical protein
MERLSGVLSHAFLLISHGTKPHNGRRSKNKRVFRFPGHLAEIPALFDPALSNGNTVVISAEREKETAVDGIQDRKGYSLPGHLR